MYISPEFSNDNVEEAQPFTMERQSMKSFSMIFGDIRMKQILLLSLSKLIFI
jgi:hypothetical protein